MLDKIAITKEEDFSKLKIGEYLVRTGKISRKVVHTALEQQSVSGEPIGDILVRNGFITQKDKIDALRIINIDQLADESTLVTRCPPQALIDTQCIIFIEYDRELYLASTQSKEDVEERLRPYYPGFEFKWNPVDIERLEDYLSKIKMLMKDSDNRVEWLIHKGLGQGASDLHIEPRSMSYSVFFRVDGQMAHFYEGDLDEFQRLLSQVKERSNLDTAERRVPQDGGFQIEYQSRMVDLRVATSPTIDGEKIVIRLLDPENTEININNIGITRLDQWVKGTKEPLGICLICGPTGSGKTTTLNATIRNMDRFTKSIYTIEDPVEYRIPYVSQVNVNHLVGLDFARGLKALLRMDPDIITVGEIRDLETANIAIKAAETGHLVLGTLHTGSITGALERLRDIGVNPGDIRNLLKSVMVQRLVRKVCSACEGEGCDSCFQSGHRGRSLISEVNFFKDGDAVMLANDGEVSWPTLTDDLLLKYKQGITSREEVLSQGAAAVLALEEWEAENGKDV
jgi:general secretion pathway protein E